MRDALQALRDLASELPADKQAHARFYVGVRLAEVAARGADAERTLAAVRRIGLETRAAAVRDAVYSGYYRVLLLTLLWQKLPDAEFRAVLAEHGEVAFLLDPATLTDVRRREPNLETPLQVLRAELRERQGRSLEAVALLRSLARELRDAPEALAPWRRIVSERLATTFWMMGDLERAEVHLDDLPRPQRLYWSAHIAVKRRDYTGAERFARELLAEPPGPARPGEVALQHLLGDVLESQARQLDGADADQRFRRALTAYRSAEAAAAAADDGPAVVAAKNGVADCLLGLGQIDAAERLYREVLALTESAETKFVEAERAEVRKDLGRLHERRGEPVAAFEAYVSALEAIEQARVGLPIDALGNGFLEPDPDFILPAVDGVLRTWVGANADPWVALAAMDRCKARGLLDWLRTPPRADPAQVDALREAVRELALTEDPQRLRERRRRLEAARSFGARSQLQPLDVAGLRAMVAAATETLFLSYWVGQREVWMFAALGGTDQITLVPLGARDEGLRLLAAAHRAVADPSTDAWPALDAASAFFVPAIAHPDVQHARRIVFCPDSELQHLPFEALRVGGRSIGLVQEVEWAPSFAVRRELARRAARGTGALVVDSIDASDVESLPSLDALEFSAIEGERVAASYGRSRRLSGAGATLEALRGALRGAPVDVVHVSGHAIYSPRVPSASLLVLADGTASMQALLDLPLEGACVVLSNCSSADGSANGGEGVAGVLWGPLGAGARVVVASRWSVNQQATADLMTQFHHWRADGVDDALAMRDARRRLADAEQYEHPCYWAGFSVYGPPAPLPPPRPWPVRPWLLGAGIAAVVWLGIGVARWSRRRSAARRRS